MIDLDAAKKLCASATPGPWVVNEPDRVCDGRCGAPVSYHEGSCCDHTNAIGCYIERHQQCSTVAEVGSEHDLAFIASARVLLPELIAEVEWLRSIEAVERITSMLGLGDPVRPDIHRRALDQIDQLRAALAEALDWALPFDGYDGRHGRIVGGYTSELIPQFTRIGDRQRADRLAELRKLVP